MTCAACTFMCVGFYVAKSSKMQNLTDFGVAERIIETFDGMCETVHMFACCAYARVCL